MCRTSFFHFPEGFHSITEDIKSTINATNIKVLNIDDQITPYVIPLEASFIGEKELFLNCFIIFHVKYISNTRRCTILSHSAADHENLDRAVLVTKRARLFLN